MIVGVSGSFVALCIAYIYFFVIPPEKSEIGILQVVLTYGHSLCWVFLAVASALWGLSKDSGWYVYFAYAGLVIYVVFIATYVISNSTYRYVYLPVFSR